MAEPALDVVDTAQVGRPRRDRDEPRLVDPDLVDRLIADAREQGVDVAGEGGLFAQLAKAVMERSLAAELTDHLGYEEGDPAGIGSGNSRNGTTPKKLATEVGVAGPGGPARPQRHLRAADGPQGPAPPGGHRQPRDRPLRPRADAVGDPGAAEGDVRPRRLPRAPEQDHRLGARGGPGVADPPARAGLSGDLPRRAGLQGPRQRRR